MLTSSVQFHGSKRNPFIGYGGHLFHQDLDINAYVVRMKMSSCLHTLVFNIAILLLKF
jgi:hypothetical protein